MSTFSSVVCRARAPGIPGTEVVALSSRPPPAPCSADESVSTTAVQPDPITFWWCADDGAAARPLLGAGRAWWRPWPLPVSGFDETLAPAGLWNANTLAAGRLKLT